MKTRIACMLWLVASVASAQDGVRFADLAGWWSADPVHGDESAHLALQFLEKDGKQVAQVSIPAVGGYGIGLGEVTINGNAIDTKGLSFPLTWDAGKQTLRGIITAEAVPVYSVPIEFKRGEPLAKPAVNEWHAPRPKVVWSADTGGAAVWAGIERDAKRGTLFVGNEKGVLSAISSDGKPLWAFETGKAIRAQPRSIQGAVYVHSDSGFVHKLQSATGKELWRAKVDVGSEPRKPTNEEGTRWDRYGSSVVADARQLYVASRDKNLYALDLKTGRENWRVTAGDIMTATPALYRDSVIFAAYDGKVQAVSAKDGKPRWAYDAKLAVAGDLTVAGERVLLGSRSYDLIALDASNGRELWKRYYWFSWIESPPAVFDGVVYTGSSDATNVYAVDLATGKVRWKTAVPGYSWQRTAVSDELVVAGTVGAGPFPGARAGSLVALDRTSGAVRWIQLEPPSEEAAKKAWGFGASPVIANGMVYAVDLGGRLHAYTLRK